MSFLETVEPARTFLERQRHFQDALALTTRIGMRHMTARLQTDHASMLLGRDGPAARGAALDLLNRDAALVRVAEREQIRRILTLDRRDVSVYRPARMGRLSIVP